MRYKLTIKSLDEERETTLHGNTVQECIDKIPEYHTFGDFEQNFYAKKGEARLLKEVQSGWYVNINNNKR